MLPRGPLVLSAFVLGLVAGSFLNVCISRIPLGESVVSPRSRCPRCGHRIRWFDNIPVASWLLLRRRCRDCKGGIPWRYPAVELGTGLWFLGVSLLWFRAVGAGTSVHLGSAQYGTFSVEAVSLAILGSLLIALLVIDWRTQTLPDLLTLPGIFIGLLLVCMQAALIDPRQGQIVLHPRSSLRLSSPGSFASRGNVFLTGTERMVFGRVGAVLAAALLLLLIRWIYFALRRREGLGLGDVKLLAMIAAFLGLAPAVLALFLGVLLGTLYALVLLSRGRADALTRLPFGSFLCAGGLLTAWWGPPILVWYKSLL